MEEAAESIHLQVHAHRVPDSGYLTSYSLGRTVRRESPRPRCRNKFLRRRQRWLPRQWVAVMGAPWPPAPSACPALCAGRRGAQWPWRRRCPSSCRARRSPWPPASASTTAASRWGRKRASWWPASAPRSWRSGERCWRRSTASCSRSAPPERTYVTARVRALQPSALAQEILDAYNAMRVEQAAHHRRHDRK